MEVRCLKMEVGSWSTVTNPVNTEGLTVDHR